MTPVVWYNVMNRTSWAISISIILIGAAGADAQGRLQSVREDVSAPAPASSSDKDKGNSSDSSSNSSNDDDGLDSGLTNLLILAPFYVPMALLNDNYEFRLGFTPHPYANGYHGYQIMNADWANAYYSVDTKDIPRKTWGVRVSLENGNDFKGLNRVGGQFKAEHESRWGIQTSWNYFRERLPCGCTDETVIGDANLTFRFAQNEMASMYAGLGFRVLTDRQMTNFGFNFTYGGDWFPMRPFIVSGVFDAGTLGSAGVIHTRGTVGVVYRGVEIFGGYDFLRIGNTNLQGPMAGVRFWF